ncbi:MAG: helix-turn-helix domain-containing protein [Mangrovibacterium sp.]
MDIMDTARFNIRKHREYKGLRQQDLADRLNMNLRSYQNLESGATKLDLERLAQIAEVLETPIEDLLRQDGVFIHQEIKEASGTGSGAGHIYNNYGVDKDVLDKLIASKEGEIQMLKEENKYLKDKIDQLLELVEKKG